MTESHTVTEEPLREPPADVVTTDGPELDSSDDETTSAGEPAAADDDADPGDDGGPESGEETPPRPSKNSWQKSVDRLTRQRAEAERLAAEERGRRLAVEERLAQVEARQKAVEPEPEEAPQPEDFDTVEEYAEAYSSWKEAKKAAPAASASSQAESQTYTVSADSEDIRTASREAALTIYPDLMERLDKVGPHLSRTMLEELEWDEDGATIAAALSEDLDLCKRIAKMPARAASKAMQRFANKVLGEVTRSSTPAGAGKDRAGFDEETPQASPQPKGARPRAKPVPTVLSGGRVTAGEPDLDSMSQAEYEAYMNKKIGRF